MTKEIDLLFKLDEYDSFSQYRNGHGGGIKVFVRDLINVNVLKDLCITSELYECFVYEILLCSRPPGSNIKDFNAGIENNLLNKFSNRCKIVFIVILQNITQIMEYALLD